ncbi:MAG TPA: EcsC family protein [Iamia sp.]|nr:EcsC family protein [Iamia sp.]
MTDTPAGLPVPVATKGWRQRFTADEITRTIIDAVHTAAESRWEPAQVRAEGLFGVTHPQKLIAVRKHFQRELVGLGTATGAVGALPGAGTATAIGVGLADIGWVTVRNADVVLTVAALHGHTQADVEERTAWILAVLVFGDAAAASFEALARELGKKAASVATSATMKKMNKAMAKKVFRSYGTKKGVLALGKALPFGVGAVFGGVSSHRSLKALVHDADRFFAQIPRVGTNPRLG